uniref:Uncharacterized protein n=1 Tax=Arundo donax TaxID=35708 RepID=A0A0A9BLK8_ARUDO
MQPAAPAGKPQVENRRGRCSQVIPAGASISPELESTVCGAVLRGAHS